MSIEMENESLNFVSDDDNNTTYLQDFSGRISVEKTIQLMIKVRINKIKQNCLNRLHLLIEFIFSFKIWK